LRLKNWKTLLEKKDLEDKNEDDFLDLVSEKLMIIARTFSGE
jgi:hypothetical protein